MSQFGKELRVYAEHGLRTVEDWISRGREVQSGSTQRSETLCRGELVALFSRDQTRPRVSSRGSVAAQP
jgi:hypothetical protein